MVGFGLAGGIGYVGIYQELERQVSGGVEEREGGTRERGKRSESNFL